MRAWKTAGGLTEGHDQIFVVPWQGVKRSLPLVSLSNVDQVIGIAEV